MPDSLMLLLVVILGLLWILDFLGILELGYVFVLLIGGAVTGLVKLTMYLIRRAFGTSKTAA